MKFDKAFETDEDASPDMTPMIDVVFLLIIFFLAAAQLSVGDEDKIRLPEASEAQPAERLNPDSITIDMQVLPGGVTFSVSGKGYTYGELVRRLRILLEAAARRGRPAPPIILRADRRVPYERIQVLMFDCASMGVRIFDFKALTGEEGGS